MITPAARHVIDDWDRSNHAATHEQRVAEGEPLLDDPNSWNVTAVGRFETPKLERIAIPAGFDELVLVTDGIDVTQLLELGVAEPSEWVRRSRHIDAGRSPRKPHDDIAMLRLRRSPGDHAGTSYSKT